MTRDGERRDAARIREKLDHPVVDGDGHLMEHVPLLVDFVREAAGRDVALKAERSLTVRSRRRPVAYYWTIPTRNTFDRASVLFPDLLYSRLDELGIDFVLLYPSYGLSALANPDEDVRRGLARAANRYYADVFGGHRDRMEPVAVIPAFSPAEAIEELDYAVCELGLKAVVLGGVLPRESEDGRVWYDTLGIDSAHDYDPVWDRCIHLGVAPAFHGPGWGFGTRASSTNYVFNHLGHFAAAQEATCRSLVLAGVPRRFPRLRLAFLEGGVSWACQLYADLLGHYEKRNVDSMPDYDPNLLDLSMLGELFDKYASGRLADKRSGLTDAFPKRRTNDEHERVNDFAMSGITSPEDIITTFTSQFFFGCEGDDPLSAAAFNSRLLPYEARLNAIFASDIGHWDVPDMRDVLPEAWELVESGALDAEQFRAFAFGNVTRMLTDANPSFFEGTAVASAMTPRQDDHA